MTKLEILNLIDFDLDRAFDELNRVFLDKNPEYNQLYKEYVYRDDNFNLRTYKGKLKGFVNLNMKENHKKESRSEIDYYDELLTDLAFQKQTKCFINTYKHKEIGMYLLHGETDDEESDLKWLCKQLLYKTDLLYENTVIKFDLNDNKITTYEQVIDELYERFEINKSSKNHEKLLRNAINQSIKSKSLVIIINHASGFFKGSGDFFNFFEIFLRKLADVVAREEGNENAIIILFNDNKDTSQIDDYKNCNRILWYDSEEDDFLDDVIELDTSELKVVDLSPIKELSVVEIKTWINGKRNSLVLFEKIKPYKDNPNCLLEKGAKSHQVIQKLCADFKIPIEKQWTTY